MNNENRTKTLGFLFGMFVTFVCLGSIFFFIKPDQIWSALKLSRPGYVIGTAVLISLYMVIRAIRWRYLLAEQVDLFSTFHTQNIGAMLTQLLPFRIGDVTKAVLIGQKSKTTVPQAISTVVVERVLDMMIVVLLFPLAVAQLDTIPAWLEQGAALSAWLAGIAVVVMITAVRLKGQTMSLLSTILRQVSVKKAVSLLKQIENLMDGLVVFSSFSATVKVLFLSFLTWTPVFVAYHTMMTAVHIENHTAMMAIFVACAGALSVAAPSSPGQIGVFHVGVTAATAVFGYSAEASAALAFLYHAVNFVVMMLLGIIGVLATNANVRTLLTSSPRRLNTQKVPIN